MRGLAIAAMIVAGTHVAMAAEPVTLHAAGSLRGVMTEIAQDFERATGVKVAATFGPSGVLRDRIAAGAAAHVFASANMEHPQALASAGHAGAPRIFARNALCLVARRGAVAGPEAVLDAMLSPALRLGTSTPGSDPSGDYAFESFAKAEALRAGARATLSAKALKLVGAADSPQPPAGRSAYAWHLAEDRVDLFLTYCTNALTARAEVPSLEQFSLPAAMAVEAAYGITLVNGAPPDAARLLDHVLSPAGQQRLAAHGFVTAR